MCHLSSEEYLWAMSKQNVNFIRNSYYENLNDVQSKYSITKFLSYMLFIRSFCNLETKHLQCCNIFSATIESYITDTGYENTFFDHFHLSQYFQKHVSPNKKSLRITKHNKMH